MKLTKPLAAIALAFSLASCQVFTKPVDMTGVSQVQIVEAYGYPATVTPDGIGGECYTYRDTYTHFSPGGHYYAGHVVENVRVRRYYFGVDGLCYRTSRQ